MPTDLTPTKPKRRPRFDAPAKPPRVEITPRDLTLLSLHQQHRFLTSHQAARLMPDDSAKKIIERIGALNAAGLLDRPRAQVDYYRAGGGSKPIVHAISNRGARILAASANLDPGRITWSHKNDSATRPFIQHTIEIADLVIALTIVVSPASRNIVAGAAGAHPDVARRRARPPTRPIS